MTRYSNPFIGNTSFGKGAPANTINLAQAGTLQMAPDLANIASNTPFVQRNTLAFLIEAPRFFQFTTNPEQAVRSLKAMLETHTRTIDGLNQQITVETADAAYGGSGERIQVPTNVTRATSSPNHGMWELQGRAIQRFIKWWIVYGIGDENTKVPLVVADGQVSAEDYDATFYGATTLYVEPDPTMTDVVSAYLCTNMYPLSTGPWESSKDVSQMGRNLDLSIEFTAATDVSIGTLLFARKMIQSLSIAGLNPNENPLWLENVSADVQSATNGLADQLERGASARVSY